MSQDLSASPEQGAVRRSTRQSRPSHHVDQVSAKNEKLVTLYRIRSGHAANVTRKIGEFTRLKEERCPKSVAKCKLGEISKAFDAFEEAHNEYAALAIKLNPDQLIRAESHFMDLRDVVSNTRQEFAMTGQADMTFNTVDDLNPSDSVSQHGSEKSSSASSAVAKAVARRAALQAKADYLKKQQELEYRQFQMQQHRAEESLRLEAERRRKEAEMDQEIKQEQMKLKELELEAELQAATAEEDVLAKLMGHLDIERSEVSRLTDYAKSDRGKSVNKSMTRRSTLNPNASVWEQKNPTKPEPKVIVQEAMGVQIQRQLLEVMSLPKTSLQTFDGDPMNFWSFMNAFDACVGNTSVDDMSKLNRLFEYCTGKAGKVIKPCALMSPTAGYHRARELLMERFGNDFRISEAWIRKVTEGPPIKPNDGDALQELADDLRSCVETLRAMNRLQEMDSLTRSVKVLDRLPLFMQGRWRKEAIDELDKTGHYPGLERLVYFMDRIAREMNDPVFGRLEEKSQRPKGKFVKPKRGVASYNVQAATQETKPATEPTTSGASGKKHHCYLCGGDHRLFECTKFKQKKSQERLEFVREKRLCFNCINGSNHMARWCRRQVVCSVDGCQSKHSKLLHYALTKAKETSGSGNNDSQETQDQGESPKVEASSYACGSTEEVGKIALPIVDVYVKAKDGTDQVKVCALLDPGSNRTFCSEALLEQLNISGTETSIALETLNQGNDAKAKEVALEVSAARGKKRKRKVIALPCVFALERFPELEGSLAAPDELKRWSHIKDLDVPVNGSEKVHLIIGQDVPQALMPLEVRSGNASANEPYATRTVLGWALNGPVDLKHSVKGVVSNFIHASEVSDVRLNDQVQQFWTIETGSILGEKPQMSLDDRKAIQVWNNSVEKTDGHYELEIPFKKVPPNLPNNRTSAEKRLYGLGRRLTKEPELHSRYKDGINDLVTKGHAEIVPPDELDSLPGQTWYLPHHCVLNPNKPDKIRIVFDCSAEYSGVSLNKEVLQGPDLINKLLGVLLRFRERPIGIMGDIKEMFHQAKVPRHHRDVLRFLWWKDGDPNQGIEVYRMTVHLFGGIWCPSCVSFVLRHTAEENKDGFDQEIIDSVSRDFYVDDCLKAVDSPEIAITTIQKLCELLSRGGFHLTKWLSNDKDVLRSIQQSERAKEIAQLDLDHSVLPVQRALGVQWSTHDDTFGIRIQVTIGPLTKRGILSVMSSLYDPFGFMCPYLLKAKLIFQSECKAGKGWDEDLDDNSRQQWQRWLNDLPILAECKVPRCLIPHDFGKVVEFQLHHFSDASQDAYGAVSYLRMMNENGQVCCVFLLGKSRLAPIRTVTIPRLELCAAVVAVRMHCTLASEMTIEINKTIFWTDSTTVLHYVKSRSKRFKTFVANRVAEIHDMTNPEQWKYVPSKQNPADDASRGLNASDLVAPVRWTQGPEFLWEEESLWPKSSPKAEEDLAVHDSIEPDVKVHAVVAEPVTTDPMEELINRYSCWYRLKRAVVWLTKFKVWVQNKCRGQTVSPEIVVEDLQRAEIDILQYVQGKRYAKELSALSSKRTLSNRSPLYSFEPFIDPSGTCRVGGRLERAPVPADAKHPIIVPNDHHIATLIVRFIHEHESKHSGKEYVLSLVRQKYWIPKCRPLVKRILKNCVVCKRLKATPCSQKMADLPNDRITPYVAPFKYVGVDCFGPFLVKRGRSQEKRYGCLFTCLVVRAIHIEKLDSLDTDSFLNGLVRFIARRGVPERIRSDNGTNFIGGERELRTSINEWNKDPKTKQSMLIRNIQWEFNPPRASNFGGVWERQIQSVRKILRVVIGNQVLDDERLSTIFCEAESIVNGRPITCVSDSPQDKEPLTPNHLLLLRAGAQIPPGKFYKADSYGRRWRHVQFLADAFWKRWIREYLPTIQLRPKWLDAKENLAVGDIVLITDEVTPRKCWPLARVTKVFPGKDGLVRAVEVQTSTSVLVRPVNKLCLLEKVSNV